MKSQYSFADNGDILKEYEVLLMNNSVRGFADAGGCGLITYKDSKMIWVH